MMSRILRLTELNIRSFLILLSSESERCGVMRNKSLILWRNLSMYASNIFVSFSSHLGVSRHALLRTNARSSPTSF